MVSQKYVFDRVKHVPGNCDVCTEPILFFDCKLALTHGQLCRNAWYSVGYMSLIDGGDASLIELDSNLHLVESLYSGQRVCLSPYYVSM